MDESAPLVHMSNPDHTFMRLRLRHPWHWDDNNQIVVHSDWVQWNAITFRSELDCSHQDEACNLCLDTWFAGHVIELVDPLAGLYIKLDELWEYVGTEQGFQPVSLEDYAHDLDTPSSPA